MAKTLGSRRSRSAAPRAVVAALAAFVAWSFPTPAARGDNQCVTCHEAEKLPISLGHSFEEWQASAHARAGVACEKCHGGNADAKTITEAHKGVLPASNKQSLVHSERIPETCGGCHPKELAAYAETVHAKSLKKTGRGANCLTCHGSMAVSLPSPAQMSERCAVCHKQPMQARAALSMLAAVKIQLYKTKRALDEAEVADPKWSQQARGRLHEVEGDYADVQVTWHRFDMVSSLKESRNLLKLAELLQEEALVRMRRGE